MTHNEIRRELLKYAGFAIVVASLVQGGLTPTTSAAVTHPAPGDAVSEVAVAHRESGADS